MAFSEDLPCAITSLGPETEQYFNATCHDLDCALPAPIQELDSSDLPASKEALDDYEFLPVAAKGFLDSSAMFKNNIGMYLGGGALTALCVHRGSKNNCLLCVKFLNQEAVW